MRPNASTRQEADGGIDREHPGHLDPSTSIEALAARARRAVKYCPLCGNDFKTDAREGYCLTCGAIVPLVDEKPRRHREAGA